MLLPFSQDNSIDEMRTYEKGLASVLGTCGYSINCRYITVVMSKTNFIIIEFHHWLILEMMLYIFIKALCICSRGSI